MRMDILNKLNETRKLNAVEQCVGLCWVNEVLESNAPLREIMREFECAIDERGNLYPPDDVYTLEDLADEIVMSYYDVDKVYGVSIVTRREAFDSAMDSAMVEYLKANKERVTSLHELSSWCEDEGIYFLEDDGCMVFVDK